MLSGMRSRRSGGMQLGQEVQLLIGLACRWCLVLVVSPAPCLCRHFSWDAEIGGIRYIQWPLG